MQEWIEQVTARALKCAASLNDLGEEAKLLPEKVEELRELLVAILVATLKISSSALEQHAKLELKYETMECIDLAENLLLSIQFLIPAIWESMAQEIAEYEESALEDANTSNKRRLTL